MKDMKKEMMKTKTKIIFKGLKDSLYNYFNKHKKEIYKYFFLILIGFISAIFIQDPISISHKYRDIGFFIGSFLIIVLVLFIFFKDIQRYKPTFLRNNTLMLLLGSLIVISIFICFLFAHLLSALQKGLNLQGYDSFIFGIPIPIGAMFITLIFDFHIAILFSFIISILVGIWFDSTYYQIYMLVGSLVAAFFVLKSRKRSSIIIGGLYVIAANIISSSFILLIRGDLFSTSAFSVFLFAATSGISISATVFLVLPLIEYLFGIKTDMSLIELLNYEQHLIGTLMMEAPGTYHHSVITANLAESTAEEIGVNPVLVRVASYYHDIGKIKMPEYFIENQKQPVNRHEKLTPHMSSIILSSHIKEGVELARQYKLPQSIIDIIQQHHGTSLMVYFYQKAVEQDLGSPPSEELYRYFGPKPQTRVAALIMMADAVEAASRSISEPTPARIEAIVEKIINGIFLDGQIDECEITLKDLSIVKKKFTYILNSIFHKRIEYPDINTLSKKQR